MKIALLHYHLKPGGVSTVLREQVQALRQYADTLVLSGEAPTIALDAAAVDIPSLGYDSAASERTSAAELADAVLAAIHARWPQGCDILHVHNPTLGKNRHWLEMLQILAQRGVRLFLQIHDFAEDGRAQIPVSPVYPTNSHYAVINTRDYHILNRCGLHRNGLHLLPNALRPLPAADGPPPTSAISSLYPVRAIRRKNIGEAVLLSCYLKPQTSVGITLPPNSAEDMRSYSHWKQFVANHGLAVQFDCGLAHPLPELVAMAQNVVTTSITEGFGFSFLGPWIAGKLLWGRKLPEICSDFESKGINLRHLYTHIMCPLDWIGRDAFYTKWRECLCHAADRLQLSIESVQIKAAFQTLTAEGHIDFGVLDEADQRGVLVHVLQNRRHHAHLIEINPWLKHPDHVSEPQALIRQNRDVILRHYNPEVYRDRLLAAYGHVLRHAVTHQLDHRCLRSHFFEPLSFNLLKWSRYAR